MREILFRGKRIDNGEWVEGFYSRVTNNWEQKNVHFITCFKDLDNGETVLTRQEIVIPETIGQYTGLTDKNGKKIFEGDIVQYLTFDDFDCQSIVKFGEYKQDGSGGEYNGRDCIGFYVEVDNFTCPEWCENEPDCFSDYLKQQNIKEVAQECEVIGNIHDNPELLNGNKDNG